MNKSPTVYDHEPPYGWEAGPCNHCDGTGKVGVEGVGLVACRECDGSRQLDYPVTMERHIERLEAERKVLRAALAFYADPVNYKLVGLMSIWMVGYDKGEHARRALADSQQRVAMLEAAATPAREAQEDDTTAWLALSIEQNGWQAVWAVDECGRHLHTEPVCTIPVGHGHRWFAEFLDGMKVVFLHVRLSPPCPSSTADDASPAASTDAPGGE